LYVLFLFCFLSLLSCDHLWKIPRQNEQRRYKDRSKRAGRIASFG